MPQISKSYLAKACALSLLVMALSGCGDANPQLVVNPATGQHAANWLTAGHEATAKADSASCAECHGLDLQGGISRVSCTQCHLGNTESVHPVLWKTFAYAFHADYVKTSATGSSSCAVASCHGVDLLGVADSGPSCAVNCHMAVTEEGRPQTHAWVATTTLANIAGHKAYFGANPVDFSSCRNNACHGGAGAIAGSSKDLQGVFWSGPACSSTSCHGSGIPLPAEN